MAHKHTPGPWTVSISKDTNGNPAGLWILKYWQPNGWVFHVCHLPAQKKDEKDWVEQQANAALISCAPELLVELEKCVERVVELHAGTEEDSTVASARAVLAKAQDCTTIIDADLDAKIEKLEKELELLKKTRARNARPFRPSGRRSTTRDHGRREDHHHMEPHLTRSNQTCSQKGALAELAVATELIRRGCQVFTPLRADSQSI